MNIVLLKGGEFMSNDAMESINEKFYAIYKEYYRKISFYCQRRLQSCPDIIDDCVQDVFLALLTQMQKGVEIENVFLWLTSCANNRIYTIYRENSIQRTRQISIDSFDSVEMPDFATEKDPLQEILNKITDEEIEKYKDKIIENLSEKDKKLLNDLCDGVKLKTIAERENLSLSAIKSRSSRLKSKIKENIKNLEL